MILTPARAGLARSGATRSGYPILQGAKVPLYALSNVARSGATRSGYVSPRVFIDIGGVPADQHILWAGASIVDTLDETPTTGTISTFQFHPVEGQDVNVRLGSRNSARALFRGTILAITRRYDGKPANSFDDCRLIDYTWQLGQRSVRTRYVNATVAAIVADLVATYAPAGYTVRVAADIGAVVVNEISFTETELPGCLTQLTRRVGGSWLCDYNKVVQVFFENTLATNPRPLNAVHPTLLEFVSTRDLSQIVTRAICEGGGVNAFATCAVGETILPLDGDPGWYSTTGGLVVSGPQRITYTGVSLSTGGGMVGPGAAPSGRPTLTQTTGAGIESGTHTYAVTFTTASGESIAGPLSTIETGPVTQPATAPVLGTPQGGTGPDVGTHGYAVTFVTATGETVAGPTVSIATGVCPEPTTAPVVGTPLPNATGVDAGMHEYALTFTNASGETTQGPFGAPVATAPAPAPGSAPNCSATGGTGLAVGTYSYCFTFVTGSGESTPSPLASITTHVVSAPTVKPVATTSPHGSYPARGPSATWPKPGDSVFFVLCNFDSAGGQSGPGAQSNTIIAQQGGDQPGWTANMQVNFPAEPAPGVKYRLAYMYKNGVFCGYSGAYGALIDGVNAMPPGAYYCGDVMGYFGGPDFVPPGAPATVHGSFNQRGSVGVGAGAPGTTARRIYRTAVNQSTNHRLAGTQDGNVGVFYIDSTPDASLGAPAPTVNTAGTNSEMPLSGIEKGPAGTTGRKLYRRSGGAPGLKLVTTIANNTATTYTDTTPTKDLPGATANQTAAITAAENAATTAATAFATPNTTNYNNAAAAANVAASNFTNEGSSLSLTASARFQTSAAALTQCAADPANAAYKSNAQAAVNAANAAATEAINAFPRIAPPTVNTATTRVIPLSAIPVGAALVTSRKLYRTAANAAQLKLLATLADNTTTTYTDTILDASLGANVPTVTTATANRVILTAIPIGASAVTSRKIYRTAANTSQLKLLTTLADNVTTTYTDSSSLAALGANVPIADTSGLTQPQGSVNPGSTSIQLANISPFPAQGWAVIGNGQQVIRYTGVSGNSLTGIPASGPGAIVAAISFNSTVTAAPVLTGIPASGTGSIRFPVLAGDEVNVLIILDDVAAQAALAALIGGTGIQEHYDQDRRLSIRESTARAKAQLELRRDVSVELQFRTHDINTRAGATISVNLGAPFFITGDFLIQQVTTEFIPTRPAMPPRFTASASSYRLSFEDLLRAIKAKD